MTAQLVESKPVDLQSLVETFQLPALPQTAITLLRLAQDDENGPEEFSAPIEADPGLASQVLKFVNSSYFGFSGEIATVKMAITLVGIRTIQNFALWSAVFSLMPNPKCGTLDVKRLWQDSLRRALFARLFAREHKCGMKDAEEAFAAALLQDMAIPLLAKELPEVYEELLSKRDTARLSVLEKTRFGWDHAEAAEVIAKTWKLPKGLGNLIAIHAEDNCPSTVRERPDQVAVWLSGLLPASIDQNWQELPKFEGAFRQVSDQPSPTDLLQQVDEAFEDFAPLLQLATPPTTLVDLYHQQREELAG